MTAGTYTYGDLLAVAGRADEALMARDSVSKTPPGIPYSSVRHAKLVISLREPRLKRYEAGNVRGIYTNFVATF